jgi:hypothetical protein
VWPNELFVEGTQSRVDGRATTRHLHGTTERAARCGTVKVSAESFDAVSSEIIVPSTLTTGALCLTRTTMVLMLVNLQGAAVIFRVGRHHHRGPFCEGRGLTHALTDTAPTDLPLTHGRLRLTAGCPATV